MSAIASSAYLYCVQTIDVLYCVHLLTIDTSFVREDPQNPIVSGNKELMKLLSTQKLVSKYNSFFLSLLLPQCSSFGGEKQSHVLLNIHGHSHFSPGQCVVGKTRILNPGPLQ